MASESKCPDCEAWLDARVSQHLVSVTTLRFESGHPVPCERREHVPIDREALNHELQALFGGKAAMTVRHHIAGWRDAPR